MRTSRIFWSLLLLFLSLTAAARAQGDRDSLAAATTDPLTVQTAFAQDYDRILSYQVDVTPNVNDGSLAIRLSFRWKALEDLPATNSQKGGVKIGIPNGSIRDMKALSDNIADIQNDNSYAYVDFTQCYKAG